MARRPTTKPAATVAVKPAAQPVTIDGHEYDFAAMPPARQEIVRQMIELGQAIQANQQRLAQDQARQQHLSAMFHADVDAAQ